MFVYSGTAHGCFCATMTEFIIVMEFTWLNEPKTFLSPFMENLANSWSRELSEWKTIAFLYIMFLSLDQALN